MVSGERPRVALIVDDWFSGRSAEAARGVGVLTAGQEITGCDRAMPCRVLAPDEGTTS